MINSLSRPECKLGYPLSQLAHQLEKTDFNALNRYLWGQGLNLCDEGCCHGIVVRSIDVKRFIANQEIRSRHASTHQCKRLGQTTERQSMGPLKAKKEQEVETVEPEVTPAAEPGPPAEPEPAEDSTDANEANKEE